MLSLISKLFITLQCLQQNVPLRKKYPNGIFSRPYFPLFGLNAENYSVKFRIPAKYGKIRTRKNSKLRRFSHSVPESIEIIKGKFGWK